MTEAKDAAGTANDTTTLYEYGPNADLANGYGGDWTQQTAKTVYDSSHSPLATDHYSYNLQGRMSQVDVDSDGNGDLEDRYEFTYDASGIRVSQTATTDTDSDGSLADETPVETKYLNDGNNPTGYSQVLEEKDGSGNVTKSYTLGLDVVAQQAPAIQSGGNLFLLYDGHGSTRGLVDATGQPLSGQVFRYDAYGNRLDSNSALTSLLYSGEQTDGTGLQYLRARYYDPASGRFNRLDPFAGKLNDPQSLHKYLYCHGDGINGIDPSGLSYIADLGTAIHQEIYSLYYINHPVNVTYGIGIPNTGGLIRPDIMDYALGQIAEIKPLSSYGVLTGEVQVRAAVAIANGVTFTYHGYSITVPPVPHFGPQPQWIPSTWQPGVRVVWPGRVNPLFATYVAVTVGNVDGVIYYWRIRLPRAVTAVATVYAIEQAAIAIGKQIGGEIASEIRHGFGDAVELIYQYRIEAAVAAAFATGTYLWGAQAAASATALGLKVWKAIAGYNTFGVSGLCAGLA